MSRVNPVHTHGRAAATHRVASAATSIRGGWPAVSRRVPPRWLPVICTDGRHAALESKVHEVRAGYGMLSMKTVPFTKDVR